MVPQRSDFRSWYASKVKTKNNECIVLICWPCFLYSGGLPRSARNILDNCCDLSRPQRTQHRYECFQVKVRDAAAAVRIPNTASDGGVDAYCATPLSAPGARFPRYAGCAVLGGPFSSSVSSDGSGDAPPPSIFPRIVRSSFGRMKAAAAAVSVACLYSICRPPLAFRGTTHSLVRCVSDSVVAAARFFSLFFFF